MRIVIDWTVALFFRNDVVQLDLQREKDALRLTASRCPPGEESAAAPPAPPAAARAPLQPSSADVAP